MPKLDLSGPPQSQPNVLAVGRRIELSFRFWVLIVLTGVGAGLAGGLLMRLLETVQHFAWSYDSGGLVEAVRRAPAAHRVAVVMLAGVLVALGAAALRLAKGGHGGDVTLAIWFHEGRTPALRTLVRAVLSVVVVGLGAAVGREGAFKQTGAVVGWRLADLLRLTAPQRRLLTACGAGAGMAAAYNIPLGGALFALEVLLGSISLPFAAPALACSMIATCASWLLLPARPTYFTPAYTLSSVEIGWSLVAGPLIGVAAVLYARLITWADGGRGRGRLSAALWPLAVFLGLAVASGPQPQLLGNGIDTVQASFLDKMGGIGAAALLLVARPLATAFCLRSGTPGGLFTPTLTTGALAGTALADAWNKALPWRADVGACAVVGAGAMIAAATEGPISAVVSVLELGQHVDFVVVPMGLAVAAAMIVMRLADAPSIYAARLRAAAAPLDRGRLDEAARARGVSERFVDVSAAAHAATALQRLLQAARANPPAAVVVLDENGKPMGRLSEARAAGMKSERSPVELVTAADLAEDAVTIPLDRLAEARGGRFAIVTDGLNGPVVGVIEAGPEAPG